MSFPTGSVESLDHIPADTISIYKTLSTQALFKHDRDIKRFSRLISSVNK